MPPIGSTAICRQTLVATAGRAAQDVGAENANFFKRRRTAVSGPDGVCVSSSFPLLTAARSGCVRNRASSRRPKRWKRRQRAPSLQRSNQTRRDEDSNWPEEFGLRRKVCGGRRVEGFDRNPGKSERNASTRNLHTKRAPIGGPLRESDAAKSAEPIGARDTAPVRAHGRRIPALMGLVSPSNADLMRRDFLTARDADRTSHRNRCHLATDGGTAHPWKDLPTQIH